MAQYLQVWTVPGAVMAGDHMLICGVVGHLSRLLFAPRQTGSMQQASGRVGRDPRPRECRMPL
eukprot:8598480-Alexandrium_andersonii.AAC.1